MLIVRFGAEELLVTGVDGERLSYVGHRCVTSYQDELVVTRDHARSVCRLVVTRCYEIGRMPETTKESTLR
jgi:hypothetical protein